MSDQNCIFCRIIKKEIPSKIIKETDDLLVIEDIHPKAPIHYLIIPKKHIINISYLEEVNSNLGWQILKMAKEFSWDLSKNTKEPISFNLISNNGTHAGQSVFHIHWHFLAGKNLYYFGGLQL